MGPPDTNQQQIDPNEAQRSSGAMSVVHACPLDPCTVDSFPQQCWLPACFRLNVTGAMPCVKRKYSPLVNQHHGPRQTEQHDVGVCLLRNSQSTTCHVYQQPSTQTHEFGGSEGKSHSWRDPTSWVSGEVTARRPGRLKSLRRRESRRLEGGPLGRRCSPLCQWSGRSASHRG